MSHQEGIQTYSKLSTLKESLRHKEEEEYPSNNK